DPRGLSTWTMAMATKMQTACTARHDHFTRLTCERLMMTRCRRARRERSPARPRSDVERSPDPGSGATERGSIAVPRQGRVALSPICLSAGPSQAILRLQLLGCTG